MLRDRDPERITHSLYLAEYMVLTGMLYIQACHCINVWEMSGVKKTETPPYVYILITVIICLANLPHSINGVSADAKIREAANRGAETISQYCRSHSENFYFEDVYSTVSFSQKIFKNVDNSLTNYDIMGGWMCKTPLYKEKLRQFGIESTQDGLLNGDGVYFIADIDEDSGTDWLTGYYSDKGYGVSLKQIDLIYDKYAVYQVIEY